ncbi:protein of hypothetical function DUF152 [Desmospora sp. 8437]|nr:protein of hypothetical function DUF152 [Desmospora sp. 8437]
MVGEGSPMEPFQLQRGMGVPTFALVSWKRDFPELLAGMSARDGESIEDPDRTNYALHTGAPAERVIQNRKRLLAQLGVPFSAWTCGEQVHGVNIHEVTADQCGRGGKSMETAIFGTDGLFTRERGILLTSFYADCVPLFFYSPDAGIVGVAHAGWRGTVGGIGPRMIRELVRRGAVREEIRAAIAPSIGGCCYEVDEQVATPVARLLPDPGPEILNPAGEGKWKLDLREANRRLLLKEGLKEHHVLVTGWCTSCHPELFHSHRRDRGRTGRMVSFIGMGKG